TLLREAVDGVVDVGAVRPLEGVGPQAKLEMQAAPRGFFADEAERLQVAVALRLVDPDGADAVAGNGDEERIGKVEIRVAELPREVVAEAEGEVDAVEAVADQHRQVGRPEGPVMEPALVLDVAGEIGR